MRGARTPGLLFGINLAGDDNLRAEESGITGPVGQSWRRHENKEAAGC